MALDEVQFGEIKGTLQMLVFTVNDMKTSINNALVSQQKEISDNKQKCDHTYRAVADIAEWKEGTPEEPGARQVLNGLVNGKGKLVAFMAGITIMGGAAGHKISDIATSLWAGLK